MKRAFQAFCVTLLAAELLVAGQGPEVSRILKDLRAALGADKPTAAKAVAIEGRATRVTADNASAASDFEMAFELPEKFMKLEVIANIGGTTLKRRSGFNGAQLIETYHMGPSRFFWATGALSSVLDNAPTYLVFFQTAQGSAPAAGPTAGVDELLLAAISLGAVFGGAMTYIGNGPNFMVKAIAEKSHVRMPSFFGYMVYSCLVLLPILALMDWIFFLRP